MSLGEKLAKLRKEHHFTQEQLAQILGVSRQAVSKWESDLTYPETEKLLKLGELYQCSMDYLLKDDEEVLGLSEKEIPLKFKRFGRKTFQFERKSQRKMFGLPLWHVNIGYGRTAKGIIAIGLSAKGIVSIGFFSLGIFSLGFLSLGVFTLSLIAMGLLSVGVISGGLIALGSISIGIVSVGALSIGSFSVGALAIGKYFAMGDHAHALIALGDTKAVGSVYEKLGDLTEQDITLIKQLLDKNVPSYLSWAKDLIKIFL
ncbi:helix-turn-helix domain-containing protein [Fervidibacillus halotolerans]|uniref:Helix-turn-helix domain-containing protein n=1 Tax=Fervidibacillus halotolerans TaxID=2980027 RepID=A0A9E8LZX3_9BACI|nr:helix-turn-helix transcriptional regulator [Fervidibacillus halotolerans]WAA12805.1 helix-turn-helix domain-containing protein [Fervidibacillus halotolerans]